MNKQKLREVIKKIEEECELCWGDVGREICESDDNDCEFCVALRNEGLVLANVASFGGEGQGDTYYYVFSVTEKDGTVTFFKVEGWYASSYGADIDPWNFKEVKKVPVQTYEWNEV